MRISVAMTTYGGEKYILEQLNSLLNQTRKADEVIIRDDRSSDNTAKIVEEFISSHGLKNWKFSINEQNLGFIKNFHKVLSEVSGDIIFLCDQDDVWHEDKLEKVERLFIEDPEITAVNSSFDLIDGEGKKIQPYDKKGWSNHNLIYGTASEGEIKEIPFEQIIKSNISPGCTIAISRKLKEYYVKNAAFLIPHDYELNIYAAELGKLIFYNCKLISYRIHSGNTIGIDNASGEAAKTSFNGTEQRREELLEVQEALEKFLRRYSESDDDAVLKYIKAYKSFTRNRRACLSEHNFCAWLKMWKSFKAVRPYITARQYVGDFIYMMKIQKLFQK